MPIGFAIILIFVFLPQKIGTASQNSSPDDKNSQMHVSPANVIAGSFNVKEFGATGDGETLDMEAINEAIEACSEAGGGTVWFPAGVYLTGTVQLKSNITLYLDPGATILGSKNLDHYVELTDPLHTRRTPKWNIALVMGKELNNIAITGHGTLDSNKVTNPEGEEDYRGPHAILLSRCEGILIENIFIRDPGNYGHQMEGCSNGNIRGVTVSGGSDGIDMFDCKDIIITECHFMTGDDCVAGGGWENIVVSNSTLNTSCSGMRNYGGGLKNVVFANLVIKGPGVNPHIISGRHDLLAGFLIHRGGGEVDNLVISNISISNIRCPLWLGAQDGASMRNVMISNLTATEVGMPGHLASIILGTAESPVENISLSNITIVSKGGGAEDLIEKPVPPTVRDPYLTIPSYGLFCRYVKDLELHDVRFSYADSDARPALICESIGRLELDGVRGQPGTASDSPILLNDIKTLISRDTEVLVK